MNKSQFKHSLCRRSVKSKTNYWNVIHPFAWQNTKGEKHHIFSKDNLFVMQTFVVGQTCWTSDQSSRKLSNTLQPKQAEKEIHFGALTFTYRVDHFFMGFSSVVLPLFVWVRKRKKSLLSMIYVRDAFIEVRCGCKSFFLKDICIEGCRVKRIEWNREVN